MLAVGADNKPPLAPSLDAVHFHRAPHALLAHADAVCQQILPHLWAAVSLLDLGVNGLDMSQRCFVAVVLISTWLGRLASAFAAHLLEVAASTHA